MQFWRVLDYLSPPRCVVCQKTGQWFCSNHASLPKLEKNLRTLDSGILVRVELDYTSDSVKAGIGKLKFRGNKALLKELLDSSLDIETKAFLGNSVLVPIPSHWTRRTERGFNQSHLLAHCISKKYDLELNLGLKKIRTTDSQLRLNRTKRLENLAGSFQWSTKSPVPDRVCLIDDVLTTGATLEEASRILKIAGVKKVIAWTLAGQTPRKW